jgi:outer membrane immunogenic protein
MKKIVLSLTAAAALSGFAMAGGDIVPAPAPLYDWSGFYVGATFGEAWNADVTLRDVDGYDGGGGTGDFSYDVDGIMGGLYAGYNWQNGNFVFGLEGEGGFIDLDDSA